MSCVLLKKPVLRKLSVSCRPNSAPAEKSVTHSFRLKPGTSRQFD